MNNDYDRAARDAKREKEQAEYERMLAAKAKAEAPPEGVWARVRRVFAK